MRKDFSVDIPTVILMWINLVTNYSALSQMSFQVRIKYVLSACSINRSALSLEDIASVPNSTDSIIQVLTFVAHTM